MATVRRARFTGDAVPERYGQWKFFKFSTRKFKKFPWPPYQPIYVRLLGRSSTERSEVEPLCQLDQESGRGTEGPDCRNMYNLSVKNFRRKFFRGNFRRKRPSKTRNFLFMKNFVFSMALSYENFPLANIQNFFEEKIFGKICDFPPTCGQNFSEGKIFRENFRPRRPKKTTNFLKIRKYSTPCVRGASILNTSANATSVTPSASTRHQARAPYTWGRIFSNF